MKRILTILLLLISFIGYSQDNFYRTIDWSTIPENVAYINDSTFTFDAAVINYNEPGAAAREIGNYFVDFVGHRFEIISSTSTTIMVVNHFEKNVAPQGWQVGRVYLSVAEGKAEYVGSVDYSPLDESSRWRLNGADNELLYRKSDSVAQALIDTAAALRIYTNISVDSVRNELADSAAQVRSEIPPKATTPETTAGVIDNKYVTPKGNAEAIELTYRAEYLDSITDLRTDIDLKVNTADLDYFTNADETDQVFVASPAFNTTGLNTGDQDLIGYVEWTDTTTIIGTKHDNDIQDIAIGLNTAKVSANDPTITIEGTAVVSTPQTFTLNQSGAKTITINDTQAAAQTLSTTGAAGNISISGGNTINLNVDDADASPTNELDNATHTGDATGATALTLATVNSNIGTYNNITINAKGLATSGSNVAYLTSFTELDPIYSASSWFSTTNNSTNWNTAYTHSQLITGNPHVVTATDVGLGNVENAAASGLYEPIFSKNTGFNLNLGTTTGTVLEGRTFGTAANNNTGDFEVPLTFSTGLNRTGNTITATGVLTEVDPVWDAAKINYFHKTNDDTDDIIEGVAKLFDKTVTFTGGTNVTIGGTYPAFVITDNSGTSNYSTSDFDTDFSGKSTTDLSEGTNLYYTEARVTANTSVAANTGKDTTGIYHANRTALDLVSGANTGDNTVTTSTWQDVIDNGTATVTDAITVGGLTSSGSINGSNVSTFNVDAGNTNSWMDFDFTSLTTAGGTFRFGRNQTTTGQINTIFYNGATEAARIDHKTGTASFTGTVAHPDATIDTESATLGQVKDSLGFYIPLTQKAQPFGVATLDIDGLLPADQVPPLAIVNTEVLDTYFELLTWSDAEIGDVGIVLDSSKTYILQTWDYTLETSWKEIISPTDLVSSVNGEVGIVTLTTGDIREDSDSRYVTDAQLVIIDAAVTTLTTIGTSGAAELVGHSLNIPEYSLEGLGGVSGTGTDGYLPNWNGTGSALEDSPVFTDGINVGIGTTSPASKLSIQTTGTTDILNLIETGGTEVMTVLENGNVGIGTTSPIQKFNVWDTPNDVGVGVYTAGTSVGIIGAQSSAWKDIDLAFWTQKTTGGNLYSEKMRITNGGNVGIGTTAPIQKLEINGGLSIKPTSFPANLYIGGNGAGWEGLQTTSGTLLSLNPGDNFANTFIGGNVGIGTTSPGTYKLNVAGTGYFSGTVTHAAPTLQTESALLSDVTYHIPVFEDFSESITATGGDVHILANTPIPTTVEIEYNGSPLATSQYIVSTNTVQVTGYVYKYDQLRIKYVKQ